MSTDWGAGFGKFAIAIALGGVTVPCWESIVLAQIIPDETLGAESSVVTPDTIKGMESDRISGGAVRGSNLFHSFRSFNIGEGRGGYFENPAAIENIFSRVTGSNPSEILGTLGVLGNANLFFLNPNGIIFGQNASLDVRGSFLGTTADSIVFPDGKQFSATNPEAPPLLTVNVKPPIGLQFEGREEVISNQGNLVVGEDLTLSAGNLDLQGQLQTGKDLTLQATDTLKIRDSATQPFIAAAGGQLLIQGNQSIDIFALNHPDSGLFSGGDLVLRSANSVGGDAHYWTGGSFRIEQLDGRLGNLFSPFDPVIRANGDVSFNSYTGASLHILAGGSVTIPGTVTITEPDAAVANSIQERVTLSDGATVVDIEGSKEPTLDIRAGTTVLGTPGITGSIAGFSEVPSTGATETSADISIGSITNNGGVVFLTNQYQPNSVLSGGITIGSIDTSSDLGGGLVAIDSRDVITVNGLINISGTSDDPLNFNFSGDGGDVTLLANGDITFVPESGIFSFGLLGGNITFKSGADISVTSSAIDSLSSTLVPGATGGDIKVIAKSLSVTDNAELGTLTFGDAQAGSVIIQASESVSIDGNGFFTPVASQVVVSEARGNGGNVMIETKSLLVADGAVVSASTFGKGDAGDLIVKAQSVEVIGVPAEGQFINTGLFNQVNPEASGNGGKVMIETEHLKVADRGQVSAATLGSGDGGTLTITTEQLLLKDGGQLSTATFSDGKAGDLMVMATEVEVIGESEINGSSFSSGLFTSVEEKAKGKGGDLRIETGRLKVADGAEVSAATFGKGDAGDLTVTATEVEVIGTRTNGFPSTLSASVEEGSEGNGGDVTIETGRLKVADGAVVSVETSEAGRAGDIIIETGQLVVQKGATISASTSVGPVGSINVTANTFEATNGGQLLTSTASSSEAGNITLKVQDSITLAGAGSGIFANTEEGSSGKGGSIFIDPGTVIIRDGAQISVNSDGSGVSGNIDLQAGSLTLDKGTITAETASNQGGDINLTLSDLLTLRNNSQITATAGTNQAEGDGGNITIDAPFIIAFPQENNDITANASFGNGGRVEITSRGIFGIEPRDEETPLSDITASSEFGQEGKVEINTSEIDPTRGLSNLPQETVAVEVAQGCQTTGGQPTLEFFAIGRGGLPPSPDDLFSSELVIAEWIPLELAEEKEQKQTLEGSFTGDEIKNMTLLTAFPCQSN
ncbi:MAG: filamentous hemagglutinin N-terminal domain-containing protein [Xenococcaceae cyanobacterium MO_234.B1]|nr:filamentous hemagglutinin N-terminal domain-containing protein [Xenococcaceae cyanobacterium MO_234.B1]